MSFIRSLMGRRQFMFGAIATSTSALLLKKSAGGKGDAKAAEVTPNPEIATKSGSEPPYPHLLSPLKIGNVVLKNRMIHSRSLPHYLQGPETFPSESVISHYAHVARNGAAVVTVKGCKPMTTRGLPHMTKWDIEDPGVQNYFSQLADVIHFYDSKASVGLNIVEPSGYSISDLTLPHPLVRGAYNLMPKGKEIPAKMLQNIIEDTAKQAKLYQSLGFDMVNIYMCYRSSILALSLSPALNTRKDKYGGSLENRARLARELFQAIKKACGQDFLIEAQISGEEESGGYTVADTVQFAKQWEDTIDILQLRAVDASMAHPTGFNSQKKHPIALQYAEAVMAAGVKVITAPIGGFQDLDLSEDYIASGKTDMIAMARAFICDPEFAQKAYEGRGEDVVPCVRCNKCHGTSSRGVSWTGWTSVCSVNPKIGLAHRINRMVDPPGRSKKVAIIGGGPAGMKAAITAAERGHSVTIYEKKDFLGGQIRYTDFASFKWPLRNFKDYLIRQTYKAGVEVLLKTKATPDMIQAEGYDAVLAGTGATPIIPDIPGADGPNVRAPIFVFGNEKVLGKSVVVIGGNEIGTETGMYLAENGHTVTVLATERRLATDATPIHYQEILQEAYEALNNFHFFTEATAIEISDGKVIFEDAARNKQSIDAESVVISAGRRSRQEDAMAFYGTADRFFIIGDSHKVGSVQTAMRSAFAAASQI